MEEYLLILRALVDAGVEYAAIGTWALKAIFPEKMEDYALHDCDLVLNPTESNLRRTLSVLEDAGWQPKVWGFPVNASTPFSELEGKHYVRATQRELVLDLTYDCPIPWEEMKAQTQVVGEVQLASVNHILNLKRRKAMEAGTTEILEAWLAARGL